MLLEISLPQHGCAIEIFRRKNPKLDYKLLKDVGLEYYFLVQVPMCDSKAAKLLLKESAKEPRDKNPAPTDVGKVCRYEGGLEFFVPKEGVR